MSIEESIDRSGSIGKRDYAMFLLATRLGLRASDIANLRFIDIDWENDEITITQYKTKKREFGIRIALSVILAIVSWRKDTKLYPLNKIATEFSD